MKIKPKIIFSSYDDLENPYYSGGGARAIHAVSKRLVNKYRVVVITAKYPGSEDKTLDGVNYKRIGLSFVGPKLGQLIYQLLLPYYLIKDNFEVWVESLTPPFSASLLPLLTRKPVVGLVHMLSARDMTRKYKLPFKFFENIGLKLYRYYICVNEVTKKQIEKSNPKSKIFLIQNGVDLPKKVTKKSVSKHILFMGRIEINQKGLDLLLKSYDLIKDNTKQKLIIAGSGKRSDVNRLKKMIKKLNLSEKVKLVGKATGDKWTRIYKNASCVIIPSRHETFSLVALEALSFNKPVVCFDIDGLRWLPNKVSCKVSPFNYEQLAEKVENLCNDDELKRKLTKNIPEFIKSYSWEKVTEKYITAIDSIMEKQHVG